MERTKALKEKDFTRFLQQCEVLCSIDFYDICNKLGLDWATQVKPSILADPGYYDRFQAHLESLKYSLFQAINSQAIMGKRRGGPDIASARAIIELIDKGILFPKKIEAEGLEEEISDEVKKRMGIE